MEERKDVIAETKRLLAEIMEEDSKDGLYDFGNNANAFTIKNYAQPKIVGWYSFGKPSNNWITKIAMHHKPNRVTRFFMRTLLDFYWIDDN